MEWIKLGSPTVRAEPGYYQPFTWPDGTFHALPEIEDVCDKGILNLLDHRRTRRTFNALSKGQLGQLLWRCARTQAIAESDYGFDLELRPAPSAGAIHPIHILIHLPGASNWLRYDSRRHGLVEISGSVEAFAGLIEQCHDALPTEKATRLLLVAEPGKTRAKYQYGESLIWRDAGALLAVMAVIADALDYSFCPLGITGEPWAGRLAPAGVLTGVGVALVGGQKPQH
ncbi:nitroreductase [Pseudomonas fluorescens]|nr:nitroreductase [Pseudomonas fluorescens]